MFEDLDAAITIALLEVMVSTEARSSDVPSGLAWVPDLQAVTAGDVVERSWRDSVSLPSRRHRPTACASSTTLP